MTSFKITPLVGASVNAKGMMAPSNCKKKKISGTWLFLSLELNKVTNPHWHNLKI